MLLETLTFLMNEMDPEEEKIDDDGPLPKTFS